jgi:hypothetical protein
VGCLPCQREMLKCRQGCPSCCMRKPLQSEFENDDDTRHHVDQTTHNTPVSMIETARNHNCHEDSGRKLTGNVSIAVGRNESGVNYVGSVHSPKVRVLTTTLTLFFKLNHSQSTNPLMLTAQRIPSAVFLRRTAGFYANVRLMRHPSPPRLPGRLRHPFLRTATATILLQTRWTSCCLKTLESRVAWCHLRASLV